MCLISAAYDGCDGRVEVLQSVFSSLGWGYVGMGKMRSRTIRDQGVLVEYGRGKREWREIAGQMF